MRSSACHDLEWLREIAKRGGAARARQFKDRADKGRGEKDKETK